MQRKKKFTYVTLSSNKTSIKLKYKDENCKWKMVVRKIKELHAFKVITYKSEHYCTEKYKQERDKHVSHKYITNKIKKNLRHK